MSATMRGWVSAVGTSSPTVAAAPHHHRPVGHLGDVVEGVGDDDHRLASVAQSRDQVEDAP